MLKRNLIASAAFALSLSAAPFAMAGPTGHDHSAAGTMAEILTGLNHYPSDGEKATLNKIAADSHATANEKAIAKAIVNLNHSVAAGDKDKLMAITKDAAASATDKDLASILLSLNHKPSDADKAKLKMIK